MSIQPLLKPVDDDMRAVDALIRARLNSDVILINTLGEYIISSGGKRLRPALVLLAARASGYTGQQHHLLAAIIEFIHTATLLHDDVVDESTMRRGQQTANTVWGNDASVLTGDFLYSRAFQMMIELESFDVMRVLADATNRIAEGEVMQLMYAHNPDLAEADYLEVVDRKTASLFSAGCRLAAQLGGCSSEQQQAMADKSATGQARGDRQAPGQRDLVLPGALHHLRADGLRRVHVGHGRLQRQRQAAPPRSVFGVCSGRFGLYAGFIVGNAAMFAGLYASGRPFF